jgi:hypothetical protein
LKADNEFEHFRVEFINFPHLQLID